MSMITHEGQEGRSGGTGFWVALRISVLFIVLCGIVYPLVSTGLAQILFPRQADGSLLKDKEGRVMGSELIGQSFTDPGYFQGRVSSIDYKAEASGSHNYAPSNPDLLARASSELPLGPRYFPNFSFKAKLSLSTLTRRSPNKPKSRPSVYLFTSDFSSAAEMPVSLLMRGT